MQQLFHFCAKPLDSAQIIGYTVVVVVASQFSFGCFPKFLCLHRPGPFQPFLEDFQLGGKLLGSGHPLHPKPFAVSSCATVMGESQKVERLRSFAICCGILYGKPSKLHYSGLCRFYFKSEFAQSFTQFATEFHRVQFVLKAGYKVVRITDETGEACATLAIDFLKPEIKGVVKIDVCQ
jgi:hypothetical protein